MHRYNDNILSSITIREDLILRQVDIEKRENGIIYKEIQKQFAPSNRFKSKTVLVDLIEDSYVFSRDKINRIIDKEDFSDVRLMYILLKIKKASVENDLKDICDLHNRFSTHMNTYVQCRSGRPIKDNIYPTRTYFNEEEVSSLFDVTDCADKLYIVYDLYNGLINTRNENDINSINLGFLSEDVFGFRELKGITSQEDELVGRSNLEVSNDYINYLSKFLYDKFGYKGEIKVDREGLLKGITYQKIVKFSLFLYMVASTGSLVLEYKEISNITLNYINIITFITTFIFTLLSLKLIVHKIKRKHFLYFSIYTFILGLIIIIINTR